MMNTTITPAERAALRELANRGPDRHLSARMAGRLALYGLIDEGPRGWAITATGRAMLRSGRVARPSDDEVARSLRPVLATAVNMAWSEMDDADGEETDT
jgi:hypothetical protein